MPLQASSTLLRALTSALWASTTQSASRAAAPNRMKSPVMPGISASLRDRMSLVVVGSIAFDAIKSPFGARDRALGGSAVHFSLAASYFTDVRVVGPVGDDFGEEEYAVLRRHGVNTDDIEHIEGGKTFFWAGEYEWNVSIRHTLDTQLNVFGEFQPKLSEGAKQADVLFLAN